VAYGLILCNAQQGGDTQQELVNGRDEEMVQPDRQGSRLLDLSRELEVQLINLNPNPSSNRDPNPHRNPLPVSAA